MPYFDKYIFGNIKVTVNIDEEGGIDSVIDTESGEEFLLDDVQIKNAKGEYIDILHTFNEDITECLTTYEEELRLFNREEA